MKNIPLTLYIHFPWCVRKCPYCDFISYVRQDNYDENIYVSAVVRDLRQELACLEDSRKISSIYIGGGTPSLLSGSAIKKLLEQINSLFAVATSAEITIEANPGTIDYAYCQGLLDGGITRISIGVQSLQDAKLTAIGRIHNAKTARESVAAAQQAGFSDINLDLMYGLPRQSIADAIYDLTAAIDLGATHISWYQFTLEPDTFFYANRPEGMLDIEVIWQMEQKGKKFLRKLGFMQYETSAYCRIGCQCRHNLNYWQFGDYLGVGVGAHGKLTSAQGSDYSIVRYSKITRPDKYCAAYERCAFIDNEQKITRENLPGEFMMNALRLYQAIPYAFFTERTGLPLTVIENKLQQAVVLGLLTLTHDSIITTTKGKNFLNDLIQIFF